MRLGIVIRYVGEKGGFRKVKKLIGVICDAIFDAQVIKNGRVNGELPQMVCVEA